MSPYESIGTGMVLCQVFWEIIIQHKHVSGLNEVTLQFSLQYQFFLLLIKTYLSYLIEFL